MSDKLESVQRQALKIIYGWNYNIDELYDNEIIETLYDRREKKSLHFANKAKETERFGKWFPRNTNYRNVRDSTRRVFHEKQCRTERTRNNPIQYMIRLLNREEQLQST